METSFCELKTKEVVNVVDGKKLGNIIDIVFCTETGKVKGLIVPAYSRGFSLFKSGEDIFIPYNNICRIGDDVILVQLYLDTYSQSKNCISGQEKL